jgi:hypothetical protein
MTAATSGYNSLAEINNLRAEGNAFSHDATDGKWKKIDYAKTDITDYDFVGADYPTNTGYSVGFIASSPTATPQTYEYEIVEIIECMGCIDNTNAPIPSLTTTPGSLHTQPVEARVVALQKTVSHNLAPVTSQLVAVSNTIKTVVDEGKAVYTAIRGAASSILEFAALA